MAFTSLILRYRSVQVPAPERQARFCADLGFSPHTEVKPVFGQEFPDQAKTCSVLGNIGLGVLLDLHDFLVGTPDNQYVWRVPMICPVKMVFEGERFLLPCVRARCGHQKLERFEFILGLSVP